MLRAYDRPGGIGIYSQYIVKYLLQIDRKNDYLLIYNNQKHVGKYSQLENVGEIFLSSANPTIWDQILVPRIIKKHDLDLIFHTKFTVPLLSGIKKVMTVHGASWLVHPEIYNCLDVLFEKVAMRLYCRAADFLIANSKLTQNDYMRFLNVPQEKIGIIHFAAGEAFRPIQDPNLLKLVQSKYHLPENFILCVMSYDPNKNFDTIIKTFNLCYQETDAQLVVVGKDCRKFWDEYSVKFKKLKNVIHFLGWIEQEDLPAVYSMAKVFFYPSIFETFGLPVLEAMACGCPVVASNTGAIPEISNGAALMADPFNYRIFAEHIQNVFYSNLVSEDLKRKGIAVSKTYSWLNAAQQTLNVFERIKQ
ncbi:MAG: glycosyltransferase family 1 protein [Dehalococcoidia bacterium]|nr:MAG: glycosyltransferase family 1 protein [Dehalococcoidia bacterium]